MKTIGGAIRNIILASGLLDDRVYLDFAPVDMKRIPYITYNDMASLNPTLSGDTQTMAYNRSVQLNLWQKDNEEDPSLPNKLLTTLDGAALQIDGLGMAPKLKVVSVTRMVDNYDDQLIHHELDLSLVNPRGVY